MALTYEELYEIQEKSKKKKKKKQDDDIAPVLTNKSTPVSSLVPRIPTSTEMPDLLKKYTPVAPTVTTSKKKDDRTWFQKGALEDGDWSKAILGSITDIGENIGTGIIGMGEKAVDFLAMAGTAMGNAQMQQNMNDEIAFSALKTIGKDKKTKDKEVESIIKRYDTTQKQTKKSTTDFVKKDLYDEEKIAKKIISAPVEKRTGIDVEASSVLGERSDALIQSGGQMLATIGLQAAGVPWFLTTGATTFGAESENALKEGASFDEAIVSSAVSAGAEILTEQLSGGIKFGGNTLDDVLIKPFTEQISNKVLKKLVDLGVDVTGEAFEEWITEDFSRLGQWLTYQDEKSFKEMFLSEEAMDAKIEAAIGGGVLGGTSNVVRAVTNRNSIELTENEQKVVDKVVEDRIAEEKADGKKVDKKKETEIRKAVLNEMLKGYIDTDTIESVLGGEEYEAYKYKKDLTDENAASGKKVIENLKKTKETLQAEYDALYKMKNGEKSDEQIDRQSDLKEKIAEIETRIEKITGIVDNLNNDTRLSDLKTKLGQNVFDLVKDSRLAESYKEIDRHKQVFSADVEQYESEYAKKTVQNAIDYRNDEGYGIDNTNASHDFIDLMTNYATDREVEIVFTTTKGLAELKKNGNKYGFNADPSETNAFVSKKYKKIFLNMDTGKNLYSLVGHEVTHTVLNAKSLGKLTKVVKAYSGKAEYQKIYDKKAETYKDYNLSKAEIEEEIVADFCGEKLLTDYDFVMHLATNEQNIFQKAWDSIKYLYKMATAGSKEARQLEKAKRIFEKAYRESANSTDTGIKHSLSEEGDYGYHAGDLGKAEGYWNMVSSNRGTGHFGTGTYFVGDEAQISDKTYGSRPHEKVDFSNYKLYKPLLESEGFELHDSLKYINNHISLQPIASMSFDEAYDACKKVEDAEWTLYWDDNATESEKAEAQKILDEAKERFEDIGYDPEKWEYDRLKEELNEIREGYRRATMHLTHLFSYKKDNGFLSYEETEKQIDSILQSIYDETSKIEDAYAARYEDSPSTRFMKAMGYEGIDVRGHKGLDNTAYGSIIYDLKGDDLARKKEIGTAKYSLSSEQESYFKDSKVRDENGNLKVMYHGTSKGGHTVFDTFGESKFGLFGAGTYFTDNKDIAKSYTEKGRGNNKQVYESYLNITNPIDMDAQADVDAWKNAFPDADYSDCVTNEDCFKAMKEVFVDEQYPQWEAKDTALDVLQGMGYDGITHIGGGRVNADGTRHQVYIAFEPEQIKNIDNIAPTKDADIRYSLGDSIDKFWENNYNEDTHYGESLRDTPAYLKPSTDTEWQVFCRSFANKTSDIGSEERKITIFTADYQYLVRADGYMSGRIVSKVNVNLYNESGDFYDNYSRSNVSDSYDEGKGNRQRNNSNGIEPSENEGADSFYVELDKFIKNHPEYFSYIREINSADRRQIDLDNTDLFAEETSSEDGVFFDTQNTKYSLSDSDSSSKNVYGFTVKQDADVNEDLLEELSIWHPDAQVDSDGNVTVYHRTSKANADKIRETGVMTALEDALFFSSKAEGYASDYGDTVVAFKIPSTVLRVNDIFDGEVHFDVPLKRINNQWSMNVSKYLVDENSTDNPDIRKSLSEEGETFGEYGNLKVYAKDIMTPADIAPVQQTVSKTEQVEGVGTVNEDDYAPMTEEQALRNAEADRDYINSFADADMPPEIDAPIYSPDTSSVDEKALKNISAMGRDVLLLNAKERRMLEGIVQKYSTSEDQSNTTLFNEIKKVFGEKSYTERIEEVAEVRQALRGYKINVSPSIKRDIADYTQFMRRNFGKIIFSKEGMPVDTAYMELSATYPDFFPSDIVNPSDQLQQMSEVANLERETTNTFELDDDVIQEATDVIQEAVGSYKEKQMLKSTQSDSKAILRDELSKDKKTANQRKIKQQQYKTQMEELVGDTSTWVDKKLGISYGVNTLRRNLRDIVRDANGKRDIAKADAIYDELQGKYNHNEAELNRESTQIKQPFADMNITKAEDTYIQMLGEFRHNPETTLTEDVVKEFYEKHKKHINEAKVDKVIAEARTLYDDLLVRVNQVLSEQGMKEIPYRKGYFPHFTEEKQGFLAKLFNWKTQNNDIPTDIAGLTENFNPNRSWQSFNKQRKSDTTDYSFLKGLDSYVQGSLDWIYHIEDLQKRRALENHIRYTHSEQGIKDKVNAILNSEEYDAEEMQEQIDLVYKEASNPLNNFVTDFRMATNTLAGKKSSLDRSMETLTNRKFYSTMTNLSNRVSANMVAGSVSSAFTNFIPITQSWGQVSPISSLRAMGETIASTFRDDGRINKSDFLTNRLRKAENLYKTNWDKVGEGVGFLMEAIDGFTSQTVWRSKYNENISKGMSENEAIKNADQFAENVLAGRSRGNNPTIFDSKNPLIKTLTVFQLEVNNQYGYMFKDMPQDVAKESKAKLVTGYATMFLGAYAYNALYSSLVGRDAAFDPIGIIEDLLRDLGLLGDDDEEEEEIAPVDAVLNLTNNLLQEAPFIGGLLGGGRIPLSSALPYDGVVDAFKGTLQDVSEGNVKSLTAEWLKPVYYLAMPMGGGQLRKTVQGLNMFSDEHPVAGSYTNSGDLRFPVEDTPLNRVQAGVFGQYANKNARTYFDEGYAPLKEKQIQEYKDVEMPIEDYWKYREGLKKFSKQGEKADYINGLDITDEQKNILKSYLYDEEGYKEENPEKYAFLEKEGIGFLGYKELDSETQESWSWAFKHQDKYEYLKENGVYPEDYSVYRVAMLDYDDEDDEAYDWGFDNPEKATFGKVFEGGVKEYRQYTGELYEIKADKDSNGKTINGSAKKKKKAYIWSLPLDEGQKAILYRSLYDSKTDQREYNDEIVDYLNSRDDITYDEMNTILEQLGAKVDDEGYISW